MFDRHDKITSLIKEFAATFIREEASTDPLITVTRVTIAPNYRQTTIYVTTIPDTREDDALIFLKRKATAFRNYLKKRVSLKVIPHVEFEIDRGERHRQHMDDVVRDIEEGEK